jgi:hypothetical protein
MSPAPVAEDIIHEKIGRMLFTVPDRLEIIGNQKHDTDRQPKEGLYPILCLKGLKSRNSEEQ